MSMVQIFNKKAEVPAESTEKISAITETADKFEKARNQFESKISEAMTQFQSLST